MNRVFADSFYFFAVLNPKDDAHGKPTHQFSSSLITSSSFRRISSSWA